MTTRCGGVRATVSGTASSDAVTKAGATSRDTTVGPSSAADATTTAVMAKLEESGRLLSARTAHNVTLVHVDDIQAALQPVNDMTGSFCHVAKMNYHLSDLDSDAANQMQNLLGDIGEMEQQFGGTAWKLYDESFRRERKSCLQ
ncbi:hypothetical protein LSAT2_027366 [Lamellibrachia satsuma]|nr:hypothetical protein LSAT2_027366 [Lamellibrachia satsuma]